MARLILKAAAFAVAGLLAANGAFAQDQDKDKSLYQRLGGYDAIAAVVDDFFGRLAADDLNGKFLATLADDRKKQARQLTIDFICQKTGGPCLYLGRDMLETHKGMGISKADWDASVVDLNATLDKFEVQGKEREEVLGFIASLEPEIVDKSK